jgi:hypothetical protein
MELETQNTLCQTSSVGERHFAFPHEVLDDPSLSLSEKRAILCAWASDRCAVESYPTLRLLPGTTFPVTFSAVMDALKQLDRLLEEKSAPKSDTQRCGVCVPFSRRPGFVDRSRQTDIGGRS